MTVSLNMSTSLRSSSMLSLQDVVESGNHQNINPSRFLAILNPEGLLEGFNLCPWNGDIVRVLDIPLVLVTALRTA